MRNYYNEIDPQAAEWIEELINRGLIPPGDVDRRSIVDVSPSDLRGYPQCHFFCGIAGWPLALKLAGIPATRPLWTGSCPCQPFSVAGEGKGIADERHLWPVFFGLIRACNPPIVFGEQVASAAVLGSASKPVKRDAGKAIQPVWLDGVFADLESAGYACGSADIPAAGVNAPHIRQRCYWGAIRMADTIKPGLEGHGGNVHDGHQPGWIGEDQAGPVGEGCESVGLGHPPSGRLGIIGDASLAGSCGHAHGSGVDCGVGDSDSQSTGRHAGGAHATQAEYGARESDDHGSLDAGNGVFGGMGIAYSNRREPGQSSTETAGQGHSALSTGFWDDAHWHHCRDNKYRRVPVESVFFTEFNGLSRLLGAGWDLCIEEISNQVEYYVESTKISRFEILREVWIAVREEALRHEIGRPESVPFPSFLLFAVCQLARNTKQEVRTSAQDFAEIEEGTMRILRQDSGKFEVSPCPPHQRRLDGSSGGKPEDPLCELSPEVTPKSDNEAVQVLLGNVSVEWNVREALAEVQKIWRRHTDESASGGLSSDIRAASGIIRASGCFPLASPEGFKVKPRGSVRPGLLKGSGNAIVPQVAAEFVTAFIKTIE